MEKCKTKTTPKLLKDIESKRIRNATKRLKLIKNDKKTKDIKMKLKIYETLARPDTKAEKIKKIKSFTNVFCNPGCVGTAFQEDVDFDTFVDDLCKPNSCNKNKKKDLVKMFKDSRKEMLKGQKKILGHDSFYHAFDKKTKKRLIKDGALSGCIVGL
jgi:hypothetical protein